MTEYPEYKFVVHMKDGRKLIFVGETIFDAAHSAGYGSGIFQYIDHAEEFQLNEAARQNVAT